MAEEASPESPTLHVAVSPNGNRNGNGDGNSDTTVVGANCHSKAHGSVTHNGNCNSNAAVSSDECSTSRWAAMPSELLRDVLLLVEAGESSLPFRRSLLSCAAVCRLWREVASEVVKSPEASGCISFPLSLKMPGPRENAILCFIKRDRSNSTYRLFLGLPPSPVENGKFLLAARKCRRATCTDYIISLDMDDMSRGGCSYVGRLRSSFLGTRFTIFDTPTPPGVASSFAAASSSSLPTNKAPPRPRPLPRQPSSKSLPGGSLPVAGLAYELNVLGTRGPRRMHCTLHAVPVSAMEPGGVVPNPLEYLGSGRDSMFDFESDVTANPLDGTAVALAAKERKGAAVADCSAAEWDATVESAGIAPKGGDGPLQLKNKAPRWHEQLQCWCLNFRGRVTVASVKNFQLVAAPPPQLSHSLHDPDRVLLQFGKIGKDMFTMDYRYPLSAFQAFAICLSSFDTKLACE